MKKRVCRDYQEKLLHDLQDPELAIAYLEEALLDGDPSIFSLALEHVPEAQIAKTIALEQQKRKKKKLKALRCKTKEIAFDRDEANER